MEAGLVGGYQESHDRCYIQCHVFFGNKLSYIVFQETMKHAEKKHVQLHPWKSNLSNSSTSSFVDGAF